MSMVKYTGLSKLCIFQQKRITNLVISQYSLHFKCMKVNILDKCIIKIPDLQKNCGIIQGGQNLTIVYKVKPIFSSPF